MKLSKTTSGLLLFLVLAIIGIGVNYASFSFIRRANLKISEQANIAEISQGRISGLFGRDENDVRAQISELYSHVPNDDKTVSFLETIEAYARKQKIDLEIVSVTIDPSADSTTPSLTETLRLRLEGEGSWQNLNNLIFFLEHLPYKSSLESVALSEFAPIPSGSKSSDAGAVGAPNWRIRAELTVLKSGPALKFPIRNEAGGEIGDKTGGQTSNEIDNNLIEKP